MEESRLLLLVFLLFKFDGQFEGWNKKQIELLNALLGFEAVDPLARGPWNSGPKSKGSISFLSQKQGVLFNMVPKARGHEFAESQVGMGDGPSKLNCGLRQVSHFDGPINRRSLQNLKLPEAMTSSLCLRPTCLMGMLLANLNNAE